jgi:replicative DNA helicase
VTDASLEAEQAVLGAILSDPDALSSIEFRAEWFTGPHLAVAQAIQSLAAERKPTDAITVAQRGAPAELVLDLTRSIGTAGNLRHYTAILESLWARRSAKRVMLEALRSERDETGEEFVGRVAESLSAIETKSTSNARRLAEVLYGRLGRIERCQKDPTQIPDVWPTGFRGLDLLVGGFRPGHLFTLAALRGVGKTSIVSAIADNLGMRQVPVAIFQLEDYADSVADRAVMRRASIPSTLMRDGATWSKEMWARAAKVVESRCDWPIFIDDTHGRTIHDIAGAMRRMHREHGIKVFMLDNLAEVVVDRKDRADERLDVALGRITKQFRDTANALGAAPVLVVHLNRDADKRTDKPKLSDIRNSSEIADAAHVVALVSRPPEGREVVIDVAKNRNGPTGEVTLDWDAQFMAVREREAA